MKMFEYEVCGNDGEAFIIPSISIQFEKDDFYIIINIDNNIFDISLRYKDGYSNSTALRINKMKNKNIISGFERVINKLLWKDEKDRYNSIIYDDTFQNIIKDILK